MVPPLCGLGAEGTVQPNHCEGTGRRVRLRGISLCSKPLVLSQIIAGRTLNVASDGVFAATPMNAQGGQANHHLFCNKQYRSKRGDTSCLSSSACQRNRQRSRHSREINEPSAQRNLLICAPARHETTQPRPRMNTFQCASIRAAGAILPKNPARRLVYVQENRLAEYSIARTRRSR